MDRNSLGSYFKKRFENHSEDTDTDNLWMAYQEHAIKRDQSKQRFFLFWLCTIAILILFISQCEFREAPESKATITEKTQEKHSHIKSAEKEMSGKVVDLSSTKTNLEITSQQIKNSQKKVGIFETQTTQSTRKNEKKFVINSSADVESFYPINISIKDKTKSDAIQSKKDAIKNKSTQNLVGNHSQYLEVFEAIPPIAINPLHNKKQVENNNIIQPLKTFEAIPTLAINPLHYKRQTENINISQFLKIEKHNKNRTILLYAGIYNPYRKTNTSVSTMDNYLKAKEDAEKTLEAFNFGIAFSKPINNTFYYSIGIEYSQINEQFQTIITSEEILDEEVIISSTINQNGFIENVYGPGQVNRITYDSYLNFNKHSFIQLPLTIGIQTKVQKFAFIAEAAFIPNYYLGFKGKMLNTDLMVVDKSQIFQSKIGFITRANLGVEYQINRNFSFRASPSLDYSLSSISSNLNQKYVSMGMQIGIKRLIH